MRKYSFVRAVIAGCYVCGGDSKIMWEGKNAQGVAVQHHDKYNHRTWVKIEMEIDYGDTTAKTSMKSKQKKLL